VSILIAILGLLVLILLHELGHFSAAKLTRMRALKFYVGFPPPLLRRRVGETEYGLGAIPLGGYVKIPGMLRPEPTDLWEVEEILDRNERLPEARAAAIGEAFDATRRELGRGRVDEARAQLDELERALDEAEPWLSAVERRRGARAVRRVREALDPRSYWRSTPARRLAVISAGPLMNVLVAFLILFGVALTGKPQPPRVTQTVAAVQSGSPAEQAGLHAGDRIVAVNGARGDPAFMRARIQGSNGGPVSVTVVRNGRTLRLPAVHTRSIDGAYRLGFQFGSRLVPTRSYSLLEAPGVAADDMWRITSGTFTALATIGSSQTRSQLTGPVGIVRYSADAADVGAPYYFTLIAVISLSLAIFNLLPFLPLDGGHILIVVLERIRGRGISRVAFERVSAFGIMLMLLAFVIGLQNDIGNLTGTGPR
jgi:regulator of sigma E protease